MKTVSKYSKNISKLLSLITLVAILLQVQPGHSSNLKEPLSIDTRRKVYLKPFNMKVNLELLETAANALEKSFKSHRTRLLDATARVSDGVLSPTMTKHLANNLNPKDHPNFFQLLHEVNIVQEAHHILLDEGKYDERKPPSEQKNWTKTIKRTREKWDHSEFPIHIGILTLDWKMGQITYKDQNLSDLSYESDMMLDLHSIPPEITRVLEDAIMVENPESDVFYDVHMLFPMLSKRENNPLKIREHGLAIDFAAGASFDDAANGAHIFLTESGPKWYADSSIADSSITAYDLVDDLNIGSRLVNRAMHEIAELMSLDPTIDNPATLIDALKQSSSALVSSIDDD